MDPEKGVKGKGHLQIFRADIRGQSWLIIVLYRSCLKTFLTGIAQRADLQGLVCNFFY